MQQESNKGSWIFEGASQAKPLFRLPFAVKPFLEARGLSPALTRVENARPSLGPIAVGCDADGRCNDDEYQQQGTNGY